MRTLQLARITRYLSGFTPIDNVGDVMRVHTDRITHFGLKGSAEDGNGFMRLSTDDAEHP